MNPPPVPNTMSEGQLTGHGRPDRLVNRTDLSVPRPGPDQILVQLLAAAVNNTDIKTRVGRYAPEVTGSTQSAGALSKNAKGIWGGALSFPLIQGGDLWGRIVDMDLRQIYLKDLTLFGSTFQAATVFERLVGLINRGQFTALVSKTCALIEIATAQAAFQTKTMAGKLVSTPGDPSYE